MAASRPPRSVPVGQDPPTLGAHCSTPSCRTLDFLPLRCPHCTLLFCQHHSLPTDHSCPLDPSRQHVQPGKFADAFADLLPSDRGVPPPERAQRDREADARKAHAKAVLEKNFGPRASTSTVAAPQAKPVAPAILLMKLKQRAKQGDPRKKSGDVAMEDRIYLTVRFGIGCGEQREEKGMRELWLPKITTARKALDLFATHFGVTNANNTTSDPTQMLTLTTPDGASISTSATLASVVPNGAVLWLVRGGGPAG